MLSMHVKLYTVILGSFLAVSLTIANASPVIPAPLPPVGHMSASASPVIPAPLPPVGRMTASASPVIPAPLPPVGHVAAAV